jgi:O-antigen/teichoic acid export membrane protein
MKILKKISKISGLDKAVSVTLLSRIWTIVGGLGTLFFVTRYLSPELQGYYYTFSSLVALQVFVELGLNFAIVQFASHEMAKLKWENGSTIVGDAHAKRRLQSLMQFSFAWFGGAALIIIVVLLPAGILFFKITAPENSQIQPEWAWVLVAIFTALVLLVNAALAILEGCNKVVEVASIRFSQMLATVLTVWVALAYNAGLYALAIGSFVMALVGALGIYRRYRIFFVDLWQFKSTLPKILWKEDIWPFQWRIAVSWASGYLIFQVFTPIMFATHGPIPAGQIGMSLQIISAMNGIGMVWITTKAPIFGQFIANNSRIELDSLFFRSFKQSIILLTSGLATFLLLLWFLNNTVSSYNVRTVSIVQFVFLSVACISNHVVFAEAAYLRAHKREPFMVISVVQGILVLGLLLMLSPKFGTSGAVAAYCAGSLFIGLPGGTIIFRNFRRSMTKLS